MFPTRRPPEATVTSGPLVDEPPPLQTAAALGVPGFAFALDVPQSSAEAEPLGTTETANEPPFQPASSFIASGAIFIGSFHNVQELVVQGRIEGDVNASIVEIEAGGSIKGQVVAQRLVVDGSLEGSVDADELEIGETARVNGDVTFQFIDVKRGAKVRGTLREREAATESDHAGDTPVTTAPANDAVPLTHPLAAESTSRQETNSNATTGFENNSDVDPTTN